MSNMQNILQKLKASKEERGKDANKYKIVEALQTGNGLSTFIMADMIKSHAMYMEIFTLLCKGTRELALGYALATRLHRDVKDGKSTSPFLSLGYNLDGTYINIDKVFLADAAITGDNLTPGRFSGILAFAAKTHVDRAARDKKALDELLSVTNPFGASHGFQFETPGEWDDDKVKMLKIYLCTTTGFDHLMSVEPLLITAICMWRLNGDHPRMMKIEADIPSNAMDREEIVAARAYQNTSSKTFNFNGKSMKLADALSDEAFIKDLSTHYRIILEYAREPTSAKTGRIVSIANTLGHIADVLARSQLDESTGNMKGHGKDGFMDYYLMSDEQRKKSAMQIRYQSYYNFVEEAEKLKKEMVPEGREPTEAVKESIQAMALNSAFPHANFMVDTKARFGPAMTKFLATDLAILKRNPNHWDVAGYEGAEDDDDTETRGSYNESPALELMSLENASPGPTRMTLEKTMAEIASRARKDNT